MGKHVTLQEAIDIVNRAHRREGTIVRAVECLVCGDYFAQTNSDYMMLESRALPHICPDCKHLKASP